MNGLGFVSWTVTDLFPIQPLHKAAVFDLFQD